MPLYPGAEDPIDPSYASQRRLIQNAIDSLAPTDKRHLLRLLETNYVDEVSVSLLRDEYDEDPYIYIELDFGNLVRLEFYSFSFDVPPESFYVRAKVKAQSLFSDDVFDHWSVPQEFRTMKKAVEYFKRLVDDRRIPKKS